MFDWALNKLLKSHWKTFLYWGIVPLVLKGVRSLKFSKNGGFEIFYQKGEWQERGFSEKRGNIWFFKCPQLKTETQYTKVWFPSFYLTPLFLKLPPFEVLSMLQSIKAFLTTCYFHITNYFPLLLLLTDENQNIRYFPLVLLFLYLLLVLTNK